ncbi:type IV secretion system DNA-binding domain-containing protein [Azorhizobium caulinodans]|uniref:type IV secretion system DNA-binding domain-containing protein n=1 Tax=Azorhizobium caulinodans TaxID=7 RepID=UPI002FBD5C64
MTIHPLTPRKSPMLANLSGIGAFSAVAIASLCALIQINPPVAWLHQADAAQTANLGFLVGGFVEMVRSAWSTHSPLSSLVNLLAVPTNYMEALQALDIGFPLALRAGAAIAAGALVGLKAHSMILSSMVARPAVDHVSGPMLVAGRAAHRALQAAWRRRFGAGALDGVALTEGVIMPRKAECEHMLVVGGTGAGKTTVLQSIMGGVLQRGDKLLALDVKGDVTACLPTDHFALLSLDDGRSACWEIGRDVLDHWDAAELAIELIPDTSDPSWSAGARRVLTGLIMHLQQGASEVEHGWSWTDLDLLLQKPVEELHTLLADEDPGAAAFIDVTREETRKQALSFYLVLIANAGRAIASCAEMGRVRGKGFSIREWLAGRGGAQALILRQSQRRPELSAALIRIALKLVADAAADRAAMESPTPTWIVLDELPQIGRSTAPLRLAAIGRSAGIRLVSAVQSPAQLREILGEDATQHFLDNSITKIIGRVAPGKTAEEISTQWIGTRTVSWLEDAGGSASGPRMERRMQDIPVADPQMLCEGLGIARDWRGRPIVRALVVGHGDVARLEWPVGRWPTRRPASQSAR